MDLNTRPPLSFGGVLEVLDDLRAAMRTVQRIRRISDIAAAKEIGIVPRTYTRVCNGETYNVETLRLILVWLDKQAEMSLGVNVHGAGNR